MNNYHEIKIYYMLLNKDAKAKLSFQRRSVKNNISIKVESKLF